MRLTIFDIFRNYQLQGNIFRVYSVRVILCVKMCGNVSRDFLEFGRFRLGFAVKMPLKNV